MDKMFGKNSNTITKLSEEDLKKLNESLTEILCNEWDFPISSETLKDIFEVCLDKYFYSSFRINYKTNDKNKVKDSVIKIKPNDVFAITLDFFKSIDIDFYNQTAKKILQLNKTDILKIYNLNTVKDFNEIDEHGLKKYYDSFCIVPNQTRISTYIPIQTSKQEENVDISKLYFSLDNLFGFVHEISHNFNNAFSLTFDNSKIPTPTSVQSRNNVLLCETTAITFERLLADYLLKNSNFSSDSIKNYMAWRMHDSILKLYYGYIKMVILNEKNKDLENNYISNDFLRETSLIFKDSGTALDSIINDPLFFKHEITYGIAAIIYPSLVKKYNTNGSIAIKQYLDSIQNGSILDALTSANIDLDNLDDVAQNMCDEIKWINSDRFKEESPFLR